MNFQPDHGFVFSENFIGNQHVFDSLPFIPSTERGASQIIDSPTEINYSESFKIQSPNVSSRAKRLKGSDKGQVPSDQRKSARAC